MNLNEQLRQAYEAGRRQGLNEDLGGFMRVSRWLGTRNPRTSKPPLTGGRPPRGNPPTPPSRPVRPDMTDEQHQAALDRILNIDRSKLSPKIRKLLDELSRGGRIYYEELPMHFPGLAALFGNGAFESFRRLMRIILSIPTEPSGQMVGGLIRVLRDMDITITHDAVTGTISFSHPNPAINREIQRNMVEFLEVVDSPMQGQRSLIEVMIEILEGGG